MMSKSVTLSKQVRLLHVENEVCVIQVHGKVLSGSGLYSMKFTGERKFQLGRDK